jgi:hypothetical protein
MVINKINKQLNEVITALEDRNIQVKNKGKLHHERFRDWKNENSFKGIN